MKKQITDCAFCNRNGKWYVRFEAYALGHAKIDANKLKGHFNITVCDSHKKADAGTFIGTGGWERIQQELLSKGKALLDRSTLKIEFAEVK